MGCRKANAPRHGHGAISDDGDGNVIIEDGSTLLFGGASAYPHIARQGSENTGVAFISGGVQTHVAGSEKIGTSNAGASFGDRVTMEDELVLVPSATQTITSVNDTILANAARITLSADGNYTLASTPCIADGTDGQILIIQYLGANTLTIPDEASVAGSNIQASGSGNIALNTRDTVGLMFDAGTGFWVEFIVSSAN